MNCSESNSKRQEKEGEGKISYKHSETKNRAFQGGAIPTLQGIRLRKSISLQDAHTLKCFRFVC